MGQGYNHKNLRLYLSAPASNPKSFMTLLIAQAYILKNLWVLMA